jgi:hypothetical protein
MRSERSGVIPPSFLKRSASRSIIFFCSGVSPAGRNLYHLASCSFCSRPCRRGSVATLLQRTTDQYHLYRRLHWERCFHREQSSPYPPAQECQSQIEHRLYPTFARIRGPRRASLSGHHGASANEEDFCLLAQFIYEEDWCTGCLGRRRLARFRCAGSRPGSSKVVN